MSSSDSLENPPRRTRWMKLALGMSLALNLAVVGAIAGAFLRHDGLRDPAKRVPGLSTFGAPYMMALPRAERRALREQVKTGLGGALPDRAARRAMFSDVLELLRRTPFDAEALEAAVVRQATTTVAVQQTAQAAWLALVSEMTDVERQKYALAVEEVLRRGLKRRD